MQTTKQRVLITWIGYSDIQYMARKLEGDVAAMVKNFIPRSADKGDRSPIMRIIRHEGMDQVHLVTNFKDERINLAFQQFVGKPAQIHSFDVKPEDYPRVFQVTDEVYNTISKSYEPESVELCVNLTSGTHSMIANLLLLGSTKHHATFYTCHSFRPSLVNLPFELDLVIRDRILKADQLLANFPFSSPAELPGFGHIVGTSHAILKAVERARRAANSNVNVLLLGESGVGKELFARAIHNASGRKGKFVPINCAAIPSELFEAEMFGATKGAGSGVVAREGYFKEADNGTLFLDEIGETSPAHQAKLLRVIESAVKGESPTILRVPPAGNPGNPVVVDVRIVAGTNRDLLAQDESDPFRNDLYHRLTFPIQIPPLRERKTDIPKLAAILAGEFLKTEKATYKPKRLSEAAVRRLKQHDWPGNVRELKGVISRAFIMSSNDEVTKADIDQEMLQFETGKMGNILSRVGDPNFNLRERLRLIEKKFVEDALTEVDGVQIKAAELLGDNYQTFNKRIHRLGIAAE
jgi:DNA-binding NtrC family response regulator